MYRPVVRVGLLLEFGSVDAAATWMMNRFGAHFPNEQSAIHGIPKVLKYNTRLEPEAQRSDLERMAEE